ncbi:MULTISPECIES: VOC family protein [Bacillus]|uniref:Ornithine monooxygenase n=1 Tax=Bacillus capparidis TaxID=1840411 RepID=A0ABS4CZF6_9BACI|nr:MULTISPECIES: VOC family protein [Bacillus]MBP1082772.1 hypothetical protein [Bacillus capparidis]MED1098416.1 VOC family protein [Bacillus capparidis]
MTVQVRVLHIEDGQKWYRTLLKREPDFLPHAGFVEWEIIPRCWLQVAEGTPTEGNGPIRLGVDDIEVERERMVKECNIEPFEIYTREGVPVKWGTFSDPWGNLIGFYEYLNEAEKKEKMNTLS